MLYKTCNETWYSGFLIKIPSASSSHAVSDILVNLDNRACVNSIKFIGRYKYSELSLVVTVMSPPIKRKQR